MATIVTPQVLVFQEFTLVPSEVTQPLRAYISGPNADLHRYADADEKPLINVGAYDKDNDTNYLWPGREPGSIVDQTYTRVFMDDAYLQYHEDLIGDSSNGRGLVTPIAGRKNWIRSSTLSYKANGSQYPRSGLFFDRDVQVGDIAYVRGVDDPSGACTEFELWTKVAGFAADEVISITGNARNDVNNQGDTVASAVLVKTGGPENCIDGVADGAAYDGLEDGNVTEVYTIEVVTSPVAGCVAARLRITSASGTDNVDDVTPSEFGVATAIGTRGLTVTFDNTGSASCSSEASAFGYDETDFVLGQIWQVTVSQLFYPACAAASGAYTGPDNDVYVIEVTKGGTFANLPEITITTSKGLDFSGPTEVVGVDTAVPIGTYGVTISFKDCPEQSVSSSSSVSAQGDDPAGLRTGDKFYITVTSADNGAIRTLILDHDLPTEIQDEADLDLKLFIPQSGLEISEDRLSNPPNVNWEQETTQIIINSGITVYDSTWTNNGVPMALPVESGTVFTQYREWLQDGINEIGAINDTADIDDIAGPLDEDNPLKWGVFKALQNSNGTYVKYTAVSDPADIDDWQAVLDLSDGRSDLYNFVPLTRDATVLGLYQGHIDSESSATSGNWKGMFFNLQTPATKMLVGESTADAQLLNPTSVNGDVVLATLEDNPNASGTQYTLLSVPAANSNFITYGVAAGDMLRFLFTTDAFGNESYVEFVVDTVLSENSLLLLTGHDVPISEPQKVEIWHNQEKAELVTELVGIAQSYSNRRVVAVWPDLVGVGGNTIEGYYLCCAAAGLASGVVPHQPLTNIEIAGFDDVASRTINYFSDSQLNALESGGVWVIQEDTDGRIYTRHALNTDVTDINSREESIRRNVDAISYLFLNRLSPFIGRANVTPSMLDRLAFEVNQAVEFLKSTGYTQELGPQLIDGEIRAGYPRVHPLLADRIQIVLDIVVPAPLNNIELHLVI
jgi:hypothetical protein